MIRTVRAQLIVMSRPAVLISLLGILPVLAVLATSLSFATADGEREGSGPDEGLLLATLSEPGGMTAGFAATSSLLGLLVLVLFLAQTAGEHSRGTLRVLLTRQPRRLRLVGGQVVAVLLLTYAALALAMLASCAAAFVAAELRGIPTDAWTSGTAVREAGVDGLRAAAAATGYGVFGAALGTVARSVPVALGIGLAWFLPLEHLIQEAWSDASNWFPGLLLEALSAGGTPETSVSRGLVGAGIGVATAAVVAGIDLLRRDVLG